MSVDVATLAHRDPGRTSLMRQREREAVRAGRPYRERRTWVPYARISPRLRHAVLIAEDDAFFSHDGFDWGEIRQSAQQDLQAGRLARGGSTITQQLAKNLWLGTERTPLRKLEEAFLAIRLERTLTKRRIFELYLNVIEWGDGVYGCEAAARRWYGTGAADLDARQAVRLAAVIVNPRRFTPVDPPRRILRRIRILAGRMHRRGQLTDDEWRSVLGLPAPESTAVTPGSRFPEGASPSVPDSGAESRGDSLAAAPRDSVGAERVR